MKAHKATGLSTTARALASGGVLAAATALGGCDWSLSFEQNMADLAEELLCPGCKPKNGNGGGGAGSGGSGGGAVGGADDDSADAGSSGEPGEPGPRARIAIGGRSWDIDGIEAVPATGDPKGATVALLATLNLSGATGEAVILLPRGEWPVKADGAPWTMRAGSAPTKRDGVAGLEIGGKKYSLEFVSSTVRVDDTRSGPRLRGAVEAHAKAEPASSGKPVTPQLVRVSFDLPAE